MMDKPPRITEDGEAVTSEATEKKNVEKIRKILSGELKYSDTLDEEETILPEPPETEEEKDKAKSKPVDGGTWHNKYDNY